MGHVVVVGSPYHNVEAKCWVIKNVEERRVEPQGKLHAKSHTTEIADHDWRGSLRLGHMCVRQLSTFLDFNFRMLALTMFISL